MWRLAKSAPLASPATSNGNRHLQGHLICQIIAPLDVEDKVEELGAAVGKDEATQDVAAVCAEYVEQPCLPNRFAVDTGKR